MPSVYGFGWMPGADAAAIVARPAALVISLAALLFIPGSTIVRSSVELPSISSYMVHDGIDPPASVPISSAPQLASIAPHPEIAVEPQAEQRSPVKLPLSFAVYYAYNEYHTDRKQIDIIADSIAHLPIGSCREEVKRAADFYALSFPMMMAFAIIESSCQPTQKTGSYIGVFQLSRYEFKRYGRTGGDIYDMRDNAMAAAHKFVIEGINFEHAVGRYPAPFDRYCIHQQGSQGCIQHQTQPDRIAWKSMCATDEGQTKGEKWCRLAIWGNVPGDLKASIKGGVETLTSGAFLAIWQRRVVHFTKIMSGIREARAEADIIPSKPRVVAKPEVAAKPQAVTKPQAEKKKRSGK